MGLDFVLLITAMTFNNVHIAQVPMTEINCKHYEMLYNKGTFDKRILTSHNDIANYSAQCLKVK